MNTTKDIVFFKPCADCGAEIGLDAGPKDGWQLEDGRTVCHACCGKDTKRIVREMIAFAATL